MPIDRDKSIRSILEYLWGEKWNMDEEKRNNAIKDAIDEISEIIGSMKRSYRFTDNPLKNGQNCKAYRQKIRN